MTLLATKRPVDAAMKALSESGRVCAQLRRRLERCDQRRFHLHRTLMRLRWELDNSGAGFMALADEILTQAGYVAQEPEVGGSFSEATVRRLYDSFESDDEIDPWPESDDEARFQKGEVA
jgi:hypothetical protein